MKKLLILGAGTAGTIMANVMRARLDTEQWDITVVDQRETHYYQPGFLFLPFDVYTPEQLHQPMEGLLSRGVNRIQQVIQKVVPEQNQVQLSNGDLLEYDLLIIATGTDIAPDEVDGLSGPGWREKVFDFYTFEGALALRDRLKNWDGGKLVVHICEMPIKCPVAPLEFAFLADAFFADKKMRDKVELTFVTPLSGAFTKPTATQKLGHLLEEKNIQIVSDFAVERVDGENGKLFDYGGKEVDFDLLVTVPTNMGDPMIARSGLGDDLNFVPTDRGTLQSLKHENIFVIGDATNVPASKAGSVAHFESEILTENLLSFIAGEPLKAEFDGHANCFVETGHGKALLIDFNYNHEPVEGTFPFPGVGPLTLLKESRMNHFGKLAFRWIYWNLLLPGYHLPFVQAAMSEAGKDFSPHEIEE